MTIITQCVVIFLSVAFLLIHFLSDKKKWREIVLAAIITALWVGFSGVYAYRETNIAFLGFNLFPFFAWTAGLVLLKAFYDRLGKLKYLKAVVLYVVALLAVEYLGYNYFGVKLASNYPGLFGLELMHAPWYSQLYYLIIGPFYLLILILLDKEKASKKKSKK
jgi:hypothetical protein